MEKQIEILTWKPGMRIFETEDQLQNAEVLWYDKKICQIDPDWRRMLFHVDNNSYNRTIGAKKKSLGVIDGPSDIIFICFEEVLFIENKLPGCVQLPGQIDFMNKVLARGHRYILNYALETFQRLIMSEIAKHI